MRDLSRRAMLWALPAVMALSAAGCSLDSFLYSPETLTSYELSTTVIPAAQRELVPLESQGNAIYGVFVKQPGTTRRSTVVYCHGNSTGIDYYWARVARLYQAGFNVFVFDYQGYGMSKGSPSEAGMYSDARAALAYVRSRPEVASDDIVFYGYSLGNVPCLHLAAHVYSPRALISESPFESGAALVRTGTLQNTPRGFLLAGSFDNLSTIPQVHAPYLLLHGTADAFVPFVQGQHVFAAANDPKQFVAITGAGHADVAEVYGEAGYFSLLQQFVAGTPRKGVPLN